MARPVNTSTCAVDGCEKKVYAKEMCRPHWWRMHKYGRTHKIVARGEHLVCVVEGCEKTKIKGNGLCNFHYQMWRIYKLHPNDYYAQLKEQNYACAICDEKETSLFRRIPGKVKQLAIDHDHKTGKLRGLLCWRCNSVLGRLEENVELFQAMIGYLNRHKELV